MAGDCKIQTLLWVFGALWKFECFLCNFRGRAAQTFPPAQPDSLSRRDGAQEGPPVRGGWTSIPERSLPDRWWPRCSCIHVKTLALESCRREAGFFSVFWSWRSSSSADQGWTGAALDRRRHESKSKRKGALCYLCQLNGALKTSVSSDWNWINNFPSWFGLFQTLITHKYHVYYGIPLMFILSSPGCNIVIN